RRMVLGRQGLRLRRSRRRNRPSPARADLSSLCGSTPKLARFALLLGQALLFPILEPTLIWLGIASHVPDNQMLCALPASSCMAALTRVSALRKLIPNKFALRHGFIAVW